MDDIKNIINHVKRQNLILRTIITVIGAFGLALIYNLFLLPQNIVIGGVSGLGIITDSLFNWNPAIFVFIANIILIIVSFIFLGKDLTMRTIIGSILYPLFISLTTPLTKIILPYIQFDNFLISLVLFAGLHGIFAGFIYKSGFTTGGSDIIMQIFNKYMKITMGKANLITSIILLSLGGLIYGTNKFIYAIIFIYLNHQIIDKIIIGISDSKMFFIHTEKAEKIKNYIINQLQSGVTIFNIEGGFSEEKGQMLMTVVPTIDYYSFKETVLALDKKAFFVITDCYEVKGGVKRKKLPFN